MRNLSRLVGGLSQLAEMVDQLLVVMTTMDVETLPDITTDYHAAKSIITHLVQILKGNASLGHHMLVDDALTSGLVQLFVGETTYILGLGDAVKNILEDDILALGTQQAHLFQGVASATDHIAIICRFGGVVVAQVNSHQVEFLLEVEVVVNHDTLVVLIWQQGEQSLAEDGLAFGLAKVQDIQTLLKQAGEYLILFHKEVWTSQEYKLHRR